MLIVEIRNNLTKAKDTPKEVLDMLKLSPAILMMFQRFMFLVK